MGFSGASVVKEPACHHRTQIQSLDWEDPLEKERATHFSILAWKFHEQRSLVGSMGLQRIGHN